MGGFRGFAQPDWYGQLPLFCLITRVDMDERAARTRRLWAVILLVLPQISCVATFFRIFDLGTPVGAHADEGDARPNEGLT